ncbi:sialin [Copidosoma floridanum]|uniref:sialin n=1 Tax=Copidosoma floridanum TaxID=29053 RepID=UPI0006C97B7C|nr:sialin [Copidosoma floridanum]
MSAQWKECCAGVSQRWVCIIMTFFSLFCAYTIRVCLSIAITEMVEPHNETSKFRDDTCPSEPAVVGNDTRTHHTVAAIAATAKGAGDLYQWSEYTQGIVLSSFYWGYVITHIPGGMIAEKFGGKYTLGFGILGNAIFTILTPLGVKYGGVWTLIFLRVMVGLAQGAAYPALNVMLSHWCPIEERSKAGSFVYAGAPLGTVFATMTSGLILRYSEAGWPGVFYFFGGLSVLWFVIWVVFCYNGPQEHPFISDAEAKFLHEQLSQHKHKKAPAVPWRHVLTSLPVWALVAAMIGHGWGFLTLISDLPKYMSSVMKFSIENNGYLSSLPYLCMWLGSIVTSYAADWLIVNKHMSTKNVRKLGNSIASVGPAVFIVGASYAGCDRALVVAMIAIGMALMGAALPSMKVNGLDLSPNYAGSLMAVTNGIASFTGILTPYIVGVLTPNQTLSEWRLVYWIIGVVFLATNFVFVVWADGDVQFWNDPDFLRKEKSDRKAKKAKEAVELLAVQTK